jgi:hypothetical protein
MNEAAITIEVDIHGNPLPNPMLVKLQGEPCHRRIYGHNSDPDLFRQYNLQHQSKVLSSTPPLFEMPET